MIKMELKKLLLKELGGLSLASMQTRFEDIIKILEDARTEIMVAKIVHDARTTMCVDVGCKIHNDIHAVLSGLNALEVDEPMLFKLKEYGVKYRKTYISLTEDKKGFKGANNSHQHILNKQRGKKR